MNRHPRRGRRFALPLALLLSTVIVHPPLLAQDGEDQAPQAQEPRAVHSDNIVVTANRLETPADEVGSSVTVITAEEIELKRQPTVAELLRTVPGVEVVRGGGAGQVTSVFLRGGSSSHTLVLVDNVRVNSATTGAYDFADLATDSIERIEIVRGPQSTLYGSEAIAGVVSIFTKKGEDGLAWNGLAEAGDGGQRRLALGLRGGDGKVDYSLSLQDVESDAVSAVAPPATETDPWDNTTLTARAGLGFAGDGRLDFHLRAFRGDVKNDGFDFALGPVDDLDRTQARRAWTAGAEVVKDLGRKVRQRFSVGVHDDELSGRDPIESFSNFTFTSRSVEVAATTEVELSGRDVLTVGLSREERRGESEGGFDETVRFTSVFVENVASLGRGLHLAAGARHDDHSTFGGETTFRLAGSFDLGSGTRLHTSVGTGFKAPTINDLFFPFFGNPELDPETSRAVDLGVERRWGDEVTVDVTVFALDFDDLIVFDFVSGLPQNLAQATSRGVEATLGWRPGTRFRLAFSYTWNDTEDEASGLPLPRRPRHRGTLDLTFKPNDRLRGVATLVAVADRVDTGGVPMDDYERLDLALHYRLTPRWEPYLRVTNLLDEDYQEVNGFTTPGILWALGLGMRF